MENFISKDTIVINIIRDKEYKDPLAFEEYFKFYHGTGKDTYINLIPNRVGIDVIFLYETDNWRSKLKKLDRMWKTIRKIHGKNKSFAIKARTSVCIVKDYNESLVWVNQFYKCQFECDKKYFGG